MTIKKIVRITDDLPNEKVPYFVEESAILSARKCHTLRRKVTQDIWDWSRSR